MTATAEKTAVLKPVLDKIIVELEGDPRQVGSIALPENIGRYSISKTERGIVRAVGPGKVNRKGVLIPPEVCPGETVILKKSMGTQVHSDGKRFVICEPEHIVAVVQD